MDMYLTSEFDIRCRALHDAKDASSTQTMTPNDVDQLLARADKILAWYLRDAQKQECAE